MHIRRWSGLILVLAPLVAFLAVSGCSRKPKPVVIPPPTAETRPVETPVAEPVKEPPPPVTLGLKDVFFDYDKSFIRGDMQEILSGNGRHLMDNPDLQVLLEGHCDERGTVEYNLALGERRAMAVKNYLLQYGVPASRLSTLSFGEEKPFVQGHDESAWSQNRRVHFVRQ